MAKIRMYVLLYIWLAAFAAGNTSLPVDDSQGVKSIGVIRKSEIDNGKSLYIKNDGASPATGGYGATLALKMPIGAVVVPAEEGALAKAIQSHGTDTVFYLKTGVHIGNGEMLPKSGSMFVGEAVSILDGGNETAKCFIHDGSMIPYTASAKRYVVTLRNLVFRNYASADQECAVMAPDTGQRWSLLAISFKYHL